MNFNWCNKQNLSECIVCGMKSGWRKSGAPWTYDLDPRLVYAP